MRTIHRYDVRLGLVDIQPWFHLEMPDGAIVRHFGQQPSTGKLSVWAEVDTACKTVSYRFYIVGTGHEVPDHMEHVLSCFDRHYVWHLYAPTEG